MSTPSCTEFWHVNGCSGEPHELKPCHICGEALETTQAGDLLLPVGSAEAVWYGDNQHVLVHDECYLTHTEDYTLA